MGRRKRLYDRVKFACEWAIPFVRGRCDGSDDHLSRVWALGAGVDADERLSLLLDHVSARTQTTNVPLADALGRLPESHDASGQRASTDHGASARAIRFGWRQDGQSDHAALALDVLVVCGAPVQRDVGMGTRLARLLPGLRVGPAPASAAG